MRKVYPVLLTVTETGKNVVRAPDVPGCVTSGKTLEEAFDNIRDALCGCLCALEDVGEPLPEASSPADVEDGKSIVLLVDVDLLEYRKETDTRAVRKNVSMPAWMAYLADKRGVNCSQVLQDALQRELQLV